MIDNIKQWLGGLLVLPVAKNGLGTLIRHGLSYISGILVALNIGVNEADMMQWAGTTAELIAAAVTGGLALLLSRVEKKRDE